LEVPIEEEGFLYTYLSNEPGASASSSLVYFDDFTVAQQSYIVQVDDYYPFGLTHQQPVAANPPNKYLFNGIELTNDFGIGIYNARYRTYDPAVGRWWQIDPEVDQFYSWTPYNNNLNNPIRYSDPDGDIPAPLIGAIIGGVVDASLQVAEIALDPNKTAADFNTNSVLVSAAAGAVGVGLATKVQKLVKVAKLANSVAKGAQIATEVAVDASASAANQFVTTGEVDAANVAIDVAAAQTIGKIFGNKAANSAKNTSEGKALARDVDRSKRVADQPKRSQGRQQAKKRQLTKDQKEYNNFVNSRSGAAATASSGAASKATQRFARDEEQQER
jgi:RHS repeat-associated protein